MTGTRLKRGRCRGSSARETLHCRYLLDDVDALDVVVPDIPAVELVSKTVEATPPVVAETNSADLGQFYQSTEG